MFNRGYGTFCLVVWVCALLVACGGGGGGGGGSQTQSQTIQFATIGTVNGVVGTTVTNTASGGGGTGAITYQSSNAAVATVDASSGLATLLTSGSTTVTATKAASAGFNSATTTYVLDVSGAQQSIAFATPSALTGEVGTQVSNVASGGAGTGAITYQSGTPTVATIDLASGVVTVLTVGTSVITATKAASSTHAAASASYTLTATPGPQTIQFASGGPLALVIGGNTTNTATGGNGGGVISYSSSDTAVATVNASTGAVTAVNAGTAVIVALKAADANYRSAQASYTLNVAAANASTFNAWIGATGTQVTMPAATSGKQLASARIADCAPGDTVPQCANAQLQTIASAPLNDTRATLTNDAYYAVVDGATPGAAVEVAATRFSERIGHAAVFFQNRYWVIGGGEPVMPGTEPTQYVAKADVWSSADGKTWRLETSNGGFSARWFHQVVVYNNQLWMMSGAPAPIINPQAPWYDDVWNSTDGVNWTLVGPQYFPWRSTDLNVVVFNNEMLAVSGGRVYSSTNGIFTQKAGSATPALTNSTNGRTHASLTVYNNELWFIGGKFDYPINVPPGGDAMNDVWKSSNGTTWTQVAANAPFAPRYRHSTFVANGRLWVLGGQSATAGVAGLPVKDAWSTTDGVQWTKENVDGIARGYLMPTVEAQGKTTLIGGLQFGHSTSTWQSANGANWVEQSAHAQFSVRHTRGVSFNGYMWIVGGIAVDGRIEDADTNEIWRSSDGANWQRIAPSGTVFSPRDGNGLVVFNNRLWVIGGWSNISGVAQGQVRLNDVWSSADGVTWRRETAAAAFSPRVGQAVAAFDSKLWVIGGNTASGNTNDVWSSTDGVTWTQVTAAAAFSVRVAHRVQSFNNAMYLIAGDNAGVSTNEIWRSTDGATWTQVTPVGPIFSARTRHALAVLNNRLYLVGGTTQENYVTGVRFNDVWSTADGVTWQQDAANAPFEPRALHALISHQGQLWVVAGFGRRLLNDVWRSADGANWRVGFSREIAAP